MSCSKEQIDAAVEFLQAEGLIAPMCVEKARTMLSSMLLADYIPRNPLGGCPGGKVDAEDIRKAPPGMRCGRPTSDDPQSGPIYCGDPAAVIADSKKCPGAIYVLCRRHMHHVGVRSLKELEVGRA